MGVGTLRAPEALHQTWGPVVGSSGALCAATAAAERRRRTQGRHTRPEAYVGLSPRVPQPREEASWGARRVPSARGHGRQTGERTWARGRKSGEDPETSCSCAWTAREAPEEPGWRSRILAQWTSFGVTDSVFRFSSHISNRAPRRSSSPSHTNSLPPHFHTPFTQRRFCGIHSTFVVYGIEQASRQTPRTMQDQSDMQLAVGKSLPRDFVLDVRAPKPSVPSL